MTASFLQDRHTSVVNLNGYTLKLAAREILRYLVVYEMGCTESAFVLSTFAVAPSCLPAALGLGRGAHNYRVDLWVHTYVADILPGGVGVTIYFVVISCVLLAMR